MTSATNTRTAQDDATFLRKMLAGTAFIRAFESKVLELTLTKPPEVQGSVHLCAGQEVVPLAAMAALREDDQAIATYRGHGWALAAGLSGEAVLGEICHRAGGVNEGRGGSAYFMGAGTRFIGENSIVGAGTTIACGVAMANVAAGNGRVVIVTIGDGAMNQGAVHEAMAFAAVRALPVIFVVENNGWSELTATGDMFLIDRLAQRGKGYGIPSATMDGTDPFAVRDAVANAAAHARAGKGPSLLEFRVPRLWGHYSRDMEHYRSKENRQADEARDPLVTLRTRGLEADHFSEGEADDLVEAETDRVDAIARDVLAMPIADVANARSHVLGGAEAQRRPAHGRDEGHDLCPGGQRGPARHSRGRSGGDRLWRGRR